MWFRTHNPYNMWLCKVLQFDVELGRQHSYPLHRTKYANGLRTLVLEADISGRDKLPHPAIFCGIQLFIPVGFWHQSPHFLGFVVSWLPCQLLGIYVIHLLTVLLLVHIFMKCCWDFARACFAPMPGEDCEPHQCMGLGSCNYVLNSG